MSNISRRKFLKGAGVAALAVAAAGVLAGCSNEPMSPMIPGVTAIVLLRLCSLKDVTAMSVGSNVVKNVRAAEIKMNSERPRRLCEGCYVDRKLLPDQRIPSGEPERVTFTVDNPQGRPLRVSTVIVFVTVMWP